MRIAGRHLGKMYLVTIVLLLALAAVGSYGARSFPWALVAAVMACVLSEFVIVKLMRQKYRIPLSAIITGIIIGSVAPINTPMTMVIVAALIAEVTKFFLKVKARNVFNPAALGLIVALVVFGAGDEWWAAPSIHVYGLLIPLAAVLVIAAYEGRRLYLALAAAVVLILGLAILSGGLLVVGGILASARSVNYYFVFLMATDPKTSPSKRSGQVAYGIGVGLISLTFMWVRIPLPLLDGLVVANLGYALFRTFGGKRVPLATGSVVPAQ
jgi:Na+-translocating ferredoxin:NAD+ oxidoreductase RnfD subunit